MITASELASQLREYGVPVLYVAEANPNMAGGIILTQLVKVYVPYPNDQFSKLPFIVHQTHAGIVLYPPRSNAAMLTLDYRDAIGMR